MGANVPWNLTGDALRAAALESDDSRTFRAEILRRLRARLDFAWEVWVLTDPITSVGIDPFARIPDPATASTSIRLKYLTRINRWTTLDTVAALGMREAESPLWRDLQRPAGVADVASLVLRDRHGCWGFLDLWSTKRFETADVALLRSMAPGLTAAVRTVRSQSFEPTTTPPASPGPAVILLDDELTVVGQTPQSEGWLRRLLPTRESDSPIPASAYNVAAQLLAREAGVDDGEAVARMPTPDGVWVRVSAARIEPGDRIAVTIEGASVAERLDAFGRVFAFTPRERELLGHLADGTDTEHVASRMHVAPYTVQDHLKSAFKKTGSHTRASLLARAVGS